MNTRGLYLEPHEIKCINCQFNFSGICASHDSEWLEYGEAIIKPEKQFCHSGFDISIEYFSYKLDLMKDTLQR